MLYGPVEESGGFQRGGRWKERGKTATSTWIEGTRYISPNRARSRNRATGTSTGEEAIEDTKCLQSLGLIGSASTGSFWRQYTTAGKLEARGNNGID